MAKTRERYLGGKHPKLDSRASDAPPLSLLNLFDDYLNEVGDALGTKDKV